MSLLKFSSDQTKNLPLKSREKILDPCLLTRQEAAQYLGLSKETLAQWASRGQPELKFIKVGRLVKYRIRDLEAFLDQRTRTIA